jgi:hypothetical protein
LKINVIEFASVGLAFATPWRSWWPTWPVRTGSLEMSISVATVVVIVARAHACAAHELSLSSSRMRLLCRRSVCVTEKVVDFAEEVINVRWW